MRLEQNEWLPSTPNLELKLIFFLLLVYEREKMQYLKKKIIGSNYYVTLHDPVVGSGSGRGRGSGSGMGSGSSGMGRSS